MQNVLYLNVCSTYFAMFKRFFLQQGHNVSLRGYAISYIAMLKFFFDGPV